MEQENASRLRKIVERVSIFRRMTLWEADAILKVCVFKTFPKGELIYQEGRPSDEMLILLQGKLVATADSGTTLGTIVPGTTTGEMGLLTNSPRSANVVAGDRSSGFVLKKADLERLFEQNERLKIKVYENLVSVLCNRLQDANVKIDMHAATVY
jgi:sulfate permease, SulP family